MSPKGDQIIMELLAQNMAKRGYDERKDEVEEGGSKVKKAKRNHETFNHIILEVASRIRQKL